MQMFTAFSDYVLSGGVILLFAFEGGKVGNENYLKKC